VAEYVRPEAAVNERLSAPLFEFRFTRAEGGGIGVSLSIFGFHSLGLNETARLQIAADNLAAMAPANAHQASKAEPLTPEASRFAQALHQSAPAAAGAGPPAAGQTLGEALGFNAAHINAAAQGLAERGSSGHAPESSLGFSSAELHIAAENLARMG
jgi:hypothetical protein